MIGARTALVWTFWLKAEAVFGLGRQVFLADGLGWDGWRSVGSRRPRAALAET
jgi:hypothetical protein